MERTELYTMILNHIKGMDDIDLADLWNGYAQENRMYDDEVFSMEYFDEMYASYEPSEVALRVFYGHDEWSKDSSFCPNREWFYLDGYGNPVSLDYIGWNEYADKFSYPSINYGIDRLVDDIIDDNYETEDDFIMVLLDEYRSES